MKNYINTEMVKVLADGMDKDELINLLEFIQVEFEKKWISYSIKPMCKLLLGVPMNLK